MRIIFDFALNSSVTLGSSPTEQVGYMFRVKMCQNQVVLTPQLCAVSALTLWPSLADKDGSSPMLDKKEIAWSEALSSSPGSSPAASAGALAGGCSSSGDSIVTVFTHSLLD